MRSRSGRLVAHDLDQGQDHGLLPLVRGSEQGVALSRMASEKLGGFRQVPRVQRVDPRSAVADRDDLATEGLDHVPVVRLDVTEHH